MTDPGHFYSFINQVLTPSAATPDAILAVADSWLVEDGRVRSLQAHFDRFVQGFAWHGEQIAGEVARQQVDKLGYHGRATEIVAHAATNFEDSW